ncbi:hypothetical protein ACSSS7_006369 [Eimeria intestinalis]
MRTVTSPSARWVEQGAKLPRTVEVQAGSSAYAVATSPTPPFPSSPKRNKKFQGGALAAAAFVLSGVALLFVCRRLFINLTDAGLAHRRLAEGVDHEGTSDEELGSILSECLDLEAEHGEFTPDGDWPEPAAKKAKLAAFLEEAAASFETAWTHERAPEKHSSKPPGWAYTGEFAWPSATHPGGNPSAGEVMSLGTPSPESGARGGVSVPGLDINPNLDPEAFLEHIPLLTEDDEEEGTEPMGPTVFVGGEDQEKPSTSGALSGELPSTRAVGTRQLGPEGHPFFRLPRILPGSVRREFRSIRDYARSSSPRSYSHLLLQMHDLFLKPALGPDEVEELMCAAELLLCFVYYHPSNGLQPPFSPAHIVRYLGPRLFILDYLFCARQLVGMQTISDEGWQAITLDIQSDFPKIQQPHASASARTHYNYDLAKRLAAAVSLLKSGVRPGAEELVDLKRMLLCSPNADPRYKAPRWDPWRADDAQYAQAHEKPSDNSEDGTS